MHDVSIRNLDERIKPRNLLNTSDMRVPEEKRTGGPARTPRGPVRGDSGQLRVRDVVRHRLLRRDPFNAVVGKEAFVIQSVDRDRLVIFRAVLDLLTIDVEPHRPVRPVDFLNQPG